MLTREIKLWMVVGCCLATFTADGGAQISCNTTATAAPGVLFACPQGDGDELSALGLTVTVTVIDVTNTPIQGIPPEDIWLIGCSDLLSLCGGSGAISASAPTDANGQTTITGRFDAGGCDNSGVRAVVQGWVVGAGGCNHPCIPIKVRSADLDRSLVINLVDFAQFAMSYPSPPKPYNECVDYTAPFGAITLADFAKYGSHSNHSC